MKLFSLQFEKPVGTMFAAANDIGIFIFYFVDRKGGLETVKAK